MKPIVKGTMILAAVLFMGAAVALAHGPDDGYGMGPGMMGGYSGYGMGPGMMGGYGGYGMGPGMRYGYGGHRWRDNDDESLPPEQLEKLQQARDKFFDETRSLRNQIGDKRYELGRELDKAQPDSAKAAQLQKEISRLESDFDQKALQYQMEVRKLVPDNFRGRGWGRGRDYGPGGCW